VNPLPAGAQPGIVAAHGTFRVLRSFPQSAFVPGERIRLDYEALPAGDSGMSGPDVPQLKPGDTLAFPLSSIPSLPPLRGGCSRMRA